MANKLLNAKERAALIREVTEAVILDLKYGSGPHEYEDENESGWCVYCGRNWGEHEKP